MTAEEHLIMFSEIKGISKDLIGGLVDQKLKEVQLSHVKKAVVSTFSGGMKRRLSLAIASLGDPTIIYLDEPTTGMDPKSKREVWKLIT